jgi:hypothetical protein
VLRVLQSIRHYLDQDFFRIAIDILLDNEIVIDTEFVPEFVNVDVTDLLLNGLFVFVLDDVIVLLFVIDLVFVLDVVLVLLFLIDGVGVCVIFIVND